MARTLAECVGGPGLVRLTLAALDHGIARPGDLAEARARWAAQVAQERLGPGLAAHHRALRPAGQEVGQ